jgi:hypothetical protein
VVNDFTIEVHFCNSQVHVRCESTVERYLAFAILLSRCALAEVKEPKLQCLAQLVHPISDKTEDGDVGLDDAGLAYFHRGSKP